MPETRKSARLLPAGLVVDNVTVGPDEVVIAAHARGQGAECPGCGRLSRQVHSQYTRYLSDVPAHGRPVRVCLTVRRFRCPHGGCSRKIFAERLDAEITQPYARRTTRLQQLVRCLGLALGGRPGQGMARRLLFPVSKDTLLRSVRADVDGGEAVAPRVIGIDDWAWKKGHRYGTIVCDLERHRVIDILPDRDAGTVEAWLAKRPGIEIVSRDRGGGYGASVTRALPDARQVADRWHLFECDGRRGRRCGRARPDACQSCHRRRRQKVPRRHPQDIDEKRGLARAADSGRARPVRGFPPPPGDECRRAGARRRRRCHQGDRQTHGLQPSGRPPHRPG